MILLIRLVLHTTNQMTEYLTLLNQKNVFVLIKEVK